jgi:hypothetical protein
MSATYMNTSKIKTQSKQWLEKFKPGPIKAKVTASQTKWIVLAVVNNRGMVYTNYRPRGTRECGLQYIASAPLEEGPEVSLKSPDLVSWEWMFHTDKAPVPTEQESAGVPRQKGHQVGSLLPLLP